MINDVSFSAQIKLHEYLCAAIEERTGPRRATT